MLKISINLPKAHIFSGLVQGKLTKVHQLKSHFHHEIRFLSICLILLSKQYTLCTAEAVVTEGFRISEDYRDADRSRYIGG